MKWNMHLRDACFSLSWKRTKTQRSIHYTFAFVIVTMIATDVTAPPVNCHDLEFSGAKTAVLRHIHRH